MLLADFTVPGVQVHNTVGTGSIATIIAALIAGWFSIKASKTSKRTNDKVGNGWTAELGETLLKIQQTADANGDIAHEALKEALEVKKLIGGTDSQIRRVRGSVQNLTGQFDQHIKQHPWKDQNEDSAARGN